MWLFLVWDVNFLVDYRCVVVALALSLSVAAVRTLCARCDVCVLQNPGDGASTLCTAFSHLSNGGKKSALTGVWMPCFQMEIACVCVCVLCTSHLYIYSILVHARYFT